jgi:hypothetical protein
MKIIVQFRRGRACVCPFCCRYSFAGAKNISPVGQSIISNNISGLDFKKRIVLR